LAFGALHLVSGITFKWWYQTWVHSLLAVGAIVGLLWFFGPMTPHLNPWWGWMLALGILMAIRDISAIQSMSTIDVRYRREGMNPFQQQKWSTLWSLILLGVGLFLLSLLLNKNPNTAYILLLLGVGFGIVPMFWGHHERTWWRSLKDLRWVSWYHAIRQRRELHLEKWRFFSEKARLDRSVQQRLLLDLSNVFHPVQIVGKRLLLPVMIVIFAQSMGWEKGAVSMMGALLGLMGLVVLLKKPFLTPFQSMYQGALYTLVGWLTVLVSYIGMLYWDPNFVFLGMLGWIFVEVAVRSWGAGFIESLRKVSGPRPHRRFYQRLLQKFFFGKLVTNGFAFVLMGFAMVINPLMGALVFGVLIGLGFWYLYQLYQHRSTFE